MVEAKPGDTCRSGKMAILLNSLYFMFNISFLPNCSVNYYGYIVKWSSGIACDWCAPLDIAYILALITYIQTKYT